MSSSNENQEYCFIIFGGTGDLTHRKLLPALYNLNFQGRLPEKFSVIAVGRRDKTSETYRNEARQSVGRFSRRELNQAHWNDLESKINYLRFDFREEEGYDKLTEYLGEFQGVRVFYLAVTPEYFSLIVNKLAFYKLLDERPGMTRLVIEKPFGRDLETARKLNEEINNIFPEEAIYRIDHYLGKEMLQNIQVIRFANSFYEPVWNNRYIDNIQFISSETGGVGSRGGYYEHSGALRDMVQNHMLQLLTLTVMEPPVDLGTDSIRMEKVKVLKALLNCSPGSWQERAVRGQYGAGKVAGQPVPGYREEERTAVDSMTETFAAIKVYLDNWRWSGVPFYIKTGKRLARKSTEVIVEFNSNFHPAYRKNYPELKGNILIFRIQPREGVFVQFNAREPGTLRKIVPVQMDFCQNCQVGINSPEAYERLIYDILQGDATLFTSWEEVEYSWMFIDQIARCWEKEEPEFPNYQAGSYGPQAAEQLLKKDKRSWWDTD